MVHRKLSFIFVLIQEKSSLWSLYNYSTYDEVLFITLITSQIPYYQILKIEDYSEHRLGHKYFFYTLLYQSALHCQEMRKTKDRLILAHDIKRFQSHSQVAALHLSLREGGSITTEGMVKEKCKPHRGQEVERTGSKYILQRHTHSDLLAPIRPHSYQPCQLRTHQWVDPLHHPQILLNFACTSSISFDNLILV